MFRDNSVLALEALLLGMPVDIGTYRYKMGNDLILRSLLPCINDKVYLSTDCSLTAFIRTCHREMTQEQKKMLLTNLTDHVLEKRDWK